MANHDDCPLVMTVTHGELEAMAIENSRVFPSCKMVIFYSYSNVYERVKD